MSTQSPLPQNDPLLIAFQQLKHTPEYRNAVNWTIKAEWFAFAAGWNARNALAATPADPVREAATALVAAAEAVVDDDPCWFDHNGNCQAHSISQPCTNAVLIGAIVNAKTALEAK